MLQKSGTEKPNCHIHDQVGDLEIDAIRETVCVNDEPLTKTLNGKHYCLFHWPSKDKDLVRFEQIFQARLKAVEQKVAEIEKLPKDEQAEARSKVSYNFRCVWFLSDVYLSDYTFLARTNFFSATFSARVFSIRRNFQLTLISIQQPFWLRLHLVRQLFQVMLNSRRLGFRVMLISVRQHFSHLPISI